MGASGNTCALKKGDNMLMGGARTVETRPPRASSLLKTSSSFGCVRFVARTCAFITTHGFTLGLNA